MRTEVLRDKSIINDFLRKSEDIQFYCIGDLDDFFWPHTTWYGLVESSELKSIALVYADITGPTLLAFCDNDPAFSTELLRRIKPALPDKFFAHLSPELTSVFGKNSLIENGGLHYKMILRNSPPKIEDSIIKRLSVSDLQIIENLYSVAYQGNWFNRRMLGTGKYFGYFIDNLLAGIAGIHVYSEKYKVSALGNIATHPVYRNRQIGFKLTSILCNDLLKSVDLIGLNVKTDNEFAIKCYRKIGFEIAGIFEECSIKIR